VTAPQAVIRPPSPWLFIQRFVYQGPLPRVYHVMLTVTGPLACHNSLIPPGVLTGRRRPPSVWLNLPSVRRWGNQMAMTPASPPVYFLLG
jgi:hypothetical protein